MRASDELFNIAQGFAQVEADIKAYLAGETDEPPPNPAVLEGIQWWQAEACRGDVYFTDLGDDVALRDEELRDRVLAQKGGGMEWSDLCEKADKIRTQRKCAVKVSMEHWSFSHTGFDDNEETRYDIAGDVPSEKFDTARELNRALDELLNPIKDEGVVINLTDAVEAETAMEGVV